MNFTDIDLENAQVSGEELNKLSYNPDDYLTINEVIDGVFSTANTPAVDIDLSSLAKNGYVISDEMETYLKAEYNGSSALKEVIKNPASYFFYVNDRDNFKVKDKSHFELGTFAHMAFLEPELFDKVKCEPVFNMASTDGIVNMCKFYEEINGIPSNFPEYNSKKISELREYLCELKSGCQFEMIKENDKLIIDLIKRNYYMYGGGLIPALLKGAKTEVSFYGIDESTGLKVKVRPDAFNTEENIGVNAIISFKTTSAQDMGKFIYDSAKFKYELSEGMYQQVTSDITSRNFNVTIMVVLQTVAPYLPAVFLWDTEDIVNGKYKYRYALDTIKDCQVKGLYPGFESLAENGHYGLIQMKQPSWAEKLLQPIDLED